MPSPEPLDLLAAVDAALEDVVDPCSVAAGTPLSLRAMGLLREVRERDGRVTVRFGVTGPGCTFLGTLARGVERAVAAVPGVRDVAVELDTELTWHPGLLAADARAALAGARGPAALSLVPVAR